MIYVCFSQVAWRVPHIPLWRMWDGPSKVGLPVEAVGFTHRMSASKDAGVVHSSLLLD